MTTRIDIAQLKQQQQQFLEKICQRLQQRPCVYHPQLQKSYAVPKDPKFVWRDARASIAGIAAKTSSYRQQIPENRTLELAIPAGGLLSRQRHCLYIIASFWTPLAECLQSGYASQPLELAELQKWIAGLGITCGDFFYIAICCPTGWEEQVARQFPASDNLALLLMRKENERWSALHDDRAFWPEILPLFDPESEAEKITRASCYLQQSPRLQVRGGYLIIADIVRELVLDQCVVEKAIAGMLQADPELIREEANGIAIIKRRRFS